MTLARAIFKPLSFLLLVYGVLAAAATLFLVGHAVAERMLGKPLIPWAHSVSRAIVNADAGDSSRDAARSGQPGEREAEGESGLAEELDLTEVRRELVRAADEIRLIEDSVSEQIAADFEAMRRQNERQFEGVMQPLANLLNVLLQDDDEWRERTGGQKLDPQRLASVLDEGKFIGDDGVEHRLTPRGIRDKIEAVTAELAAYKTAEERMRGDEGKLSLVASLPSEVIAVGLAGKRGEISDDQAVRLLLRLEQPKVLEIFTTLSDENSARAATLMGRLLEGTDREQSGIAQ